MGHFVFNKSISKDIITICGGVHPTLAPEMIMNSDDLDYFIRGEGELALTEFLRRIEAGEDLYDSPNLCFEKDGLPCHRWVLARWILEKMPDLQGGLLL